MLCFMIICCQKDDVEHDFRDEANPLMPIRSVAKLSDSIYLSDQVGKIVTNEHHQVIIPEPNYGKYYFTDSNFNFLFEFGGSGKGPGEFLLNNRGFVSDSFVYLPDNINEKIETYKIKNNNLFLVNESVNKYHIGEYGAVINNENKILTSSYLTSKPFLEIDPTNGEITDSFGEFLKHENFLEKRANNGFLLEYDKKRDLLLTINIQRPVLSKYQNTKSGYKLLKKHEYKREFVKYYNYLNTKKLDIRNQAIMFSFVEDIALGNDYLYLLVWGKNLGIDSPNILIEIDYLKDFDIKRVYRLLSNQNVESSFSSISFIGKKLIGFERYTSNILIYDLSIEQ